jgi:hypothetical protein
MTHPALRTVVWPTLVAAWALLASASCAYEPLRNGVGLRGDAGDAKASEAGAGDGGGDDGDDGGSADGPDGGDPIVPDDGGAGGDPVCGNGVVERGEQCDPPGSCPASCPSRGCTKFRLEGAAAACTAICVEAGQQTECAPDDGCCPATCNGTNDNDCLVKCDNGVKEASETCDPLATCPTACPAMGCQLRKLINPGTCTAECANDRQQTVCQPGDGCCPAGCTSATDADCPVVCGNGVKESGETCDPVSSCPTSCPAMGCQLRELVGGGTCKAACQNTTLRTTCASGDGCCPPTCNNTNDAECAPRCGNGVVERGETCEPVAECNNRAAACKSDANTIRTGKGSAAACTFECTSSPRACGPGDGACPSGCAVDPDCLPRPTDCTHLQWCVKPDAPNQGKVICITNDNPRCTNAERMNECQTDANRVCGTGHARPVIYSPPIGGVGSG